VRHKSLDRRSPERRAKSSAPQFRKSTILVRGEWRQRIQRKDAKQKKVRRGTKKTERDLGYAFDILAAMPGEQSRRRRKIQARGSRK